jgi:hypothetical protein
MASIYNQSTQTGTGRFAPSVQYNAVAKTPTIGDIEIPRMSESESINIDLQPIANAFMNSEANEAKLKMAELEHEFNLRKLEAEKEKKKKEEKDYATLRDFALGLSDLEASAKNLTPLEYQTRYKNHLDRYLMLYKGNPKDITSLASSVGWGHKEEIIANRKDQSAWEQDIRQGRAEELAKNNAFLRSLDPKNQVYLIDSLNQTLTMINQATAIENDPNATEADKEIARQTKQQSAVTLAATVWQGAVGTGEIDPSTFANEANYLTAVDLVAKRVSAATGMTYGAARLAAQMGGDYVGITDMTNDSMKKFAANKQYVEDNNKYVEALQKAQLNNIPAIRVIESLSPELRDRLLNDPLNRSYYDGIIKQYLMDFSFDETNGDATVKLLGSVEKLTNAQANEQPSTSLGRQHAVTYLDIAKDQVMIGNRNLNRSPYADYYWYMGVNGIQATLAQQAISAQSAEDLNTVATNVNNAGKLIDNPTAQAKKASIEANNTNNPIAQDMVKADKDLNTIIKGMMTLKNKLPEKDVNSLLQNANYFRTSLSANRLRLDEKTGEVKVLEDAKGVLETIGSINEANVFLNVKDFNDKMSNIKNVNDRIAIVKYLTATPSNGVIKPLQEGDVVQDEAGILSSMAMLGTFAIGAGVDGIVQPIEYARKKQTPNLRQSSVNAELRVQPVVPPTASMTDFDKYPLVKNKKGVSNVKTEIVGREVDGKEVEFIVPTMGDTSKHFGGYATKDDAIKADEQMHKELNDTITAMEQQGQLTPEMDKPVQLTQQPENLDKKLHMNVVGDQNFITYTDEKEGLQYDFNIGTKQEVFMVDDIMYNGDIVLKDTEFTGVKKKEEDDGIVLVPTDSSITGTYGWYTDGNAEKVKHGLEKLYKGIKSGK